MFNKKKKHKPFKPKAHLEKKEGGEQGEQPVATAHEEQPPKRPAEPIQNRPANPPRDRERPANNPQPNQNNNRAQQQQQRPSQPNPQRQPNNPQQNQQQRPPQKQQQNNFNNRPQQQNPQNQQNQQQRGPNPSFKSRDQLNREAAMRAKAAEEEALEIQAEIAEEEKGFEGENLENLPVCPVCEKPIRNQYISIRHNESGNPAHFHCILNQITETNREKIGKNQRVCYIGAGNFAIIRESYDKRGRAKTYQIIEKIRYEKRE